jgi:lipopolysaccharide transport system ATP-binding protein
MMVRLAFAVQACIEPEILIVDEALAVGDMLFQKRCFSRMKALAEKGTTLLFVTHDIELVRTFTSRAILLDGGKVVQEGPSADVVLDYRRRMHHEESAYYQKLLTKSNEAVDDSIEITAGQADTTGCESIQITQESNLQYGDMDGVITNVQILDNNDEVCNMFYPGDEVKIRIECKTLKALKNLNVGIRIRNKTGVKIYSWGSLNQDIAIWSGRAGGKDFWSEEIPADTYVTTNLKFNCNLGVDLYEVQAFFAQEADKYYREERMLHWIDEASFFQVNMRNQEYFFGGICDLQMKAEITANNNNKMEKKGFVL